jgi:hypothetical protein
LSGGGGGRVSIDVFSRHDDTHFLIHGNLLWASIFLFCIISLMLYMLGLHGVVFLYNPPSSSYLCFLGRAEFRFSGL